MHQIGVCNLRAQERKAVTKTSSRSDWCKGEFLALGAIATREGGGLSGWNNAAPHRDARGGRLEWMEQRRALGGKPASQNTRLSNQSCLVPRECCGVSIR